MLATKNLRTPIKTPWKEKNEVTDDQKHTEDEGSAQCDNSQEESCSSLENKTTNQSAVEDTVEKSCPSRSQDTIPACDMEKTDPMDSGPPEESKHSSGPENSEIQEDTDKQMFATSGSPFISEEKQHFSLNIFKALKEKHFDANTDQSVFSCTRYKTKTFSIKFHWEISSWKIWI